jgi:hypothetical protein
MTSSMLVKNHDTSDLLNPLILLMLVASRFRTATEEFLRRRASSLSLPALGDSLLKVCFIVFVSANSCAHSRRSVGVKP